MFTVASLWIPFTIIAALAQVVRNAMQRQLTAPLGTAGAAHIRFLFGFPFSLIFLGLVLAIFRETLTAPPPVFWLWLVAGAIAQMFATALMLAAMNERSFVVTTAYLKTEAIQTAVFGFVFLGDVLTMGKVVAIMIATFGVVLTAVRPGTERDLRSLRPLVLGLIAAAAFAFASVGYRAAILLVPGVSFVTASTFSLVCALFVQSVVFSVYLAVREPGVMTKIIRMWRPSLLAGLLGAGASQFWFFAFALTPAANVRTLALVEVLFAQTISAFWMKQPVSRRELAGIVLIVLGVGLLVAI